MQAEENRAAILQVERHTGETTAFASGLRKPMGMNWQPDSGYARETGKAESGESRQSMIDRTFACCWRMTRILSCAADTG